MTSGEDTTQRFIHRSWSELANFYSSFDQWKGDIQLALTAIGKLTLSIERSDLNSQLFAHTSHANLLICQTRNTYPPRLGAEFLVISPRNTGRLRFTLSRWGKGDEKWSRTVVPDDLLIQFNSALRTLGWTTQDIRE